MRINWNELRKKYLYGDMRYVNAFLGKCAGIIYIKCLFLKAKPELLFKYFSKLVANF